jgi:hypothetical protein
MGLLHTLKGLDKEGWCGITDGTFDVEVDSVVEEVIINAINHILANK